MPVGTEDSLSDTDYIDGVTVKPDTISNIGTSESAITKEIDAEMIIDECPVRFHATGDNN